jgi:hypothetical protein
MVVNPFGKDGRAESNALQPIPSILGVAVFNRCTINQHRLSSVLVNGVRAACQNDDALKPSQIVSKKNDLGSWPIVPDFF